MILEVDLHYLVAEPEHDCILGPHPLLDIDDLTHSSLGRSVIKVVIVLEQSVILFHWGNHGFLTISLEVRLEVE